jgi:hypothetical protein
MSNSENQLANWFSPTNNCKIEHLKWVKEVQKELINSVASCQEAVALLIKKKKRTPAVFDFHATGKGAIAIYLKRQYAYIEIGEIQFQKA